MSLLVILPIVSPDPYWQIIRFIPSGVLFTLGVTILSSFFALLIGIIVGLFRTSRSIFAARIAAIFVQVFQGIPLLVQLFFIYFALGELVRIPRFIAAVAAVSLCYGANLGDIFREGIREVPKDQILAARDSGMPSSRMFPQVILPQTFRLVMPSLGIKLIALLKDTSLVSVLAVPDLLRRSRTFALSSFHYCETYMIVALVYLLLVLLLAKVVAGMEKKLQMPEEVEKIEDAGDSHGIG